MKSDRLAAECAAIAGRRDLVLTNMNPNSPPMREASTANMRPPDIICIPPNSKALINIAVVDDQFCLSRVMITPLHKNSSVIGAEINNATIIITFPSHGLIWEKYTALWEIWTEFSISIPDVISVKNMESEKADITGNRYSLKLTCLSSTSLERSDLIGFEIKVNTLIDSKFDKVIMSRILSIVHCKRSASVIKPLPITTFARTICISIWKAK